MSAYVTVFEEVAPVARRAWAAWVVGLLLVGVVGLWLLRGRDWGVPQFVAGVQVVVGVFLLVSLLLPPGKASSLQGIVRGYERHGGSACFTVQREEVCAGSRVPVRDGQLVWVLRAGRAPVRIAVEREASMTEAEVADRERDVQRRDEPVLRGMRRVFLVVVLGMLGWMSLRWRRVLAVWVRPPHGLLAQVLFRGFVGANLIGLSIQLAEELRANPLTGNEAGPTAVGIAGLGAVAYFCFRHFVRQGALRWRLGRDRSSQ